MTLDHRNEPQPGEAARPEAPVIRAWFRPLADSTYVDWCHSTGPGDTEAPRYSPFRFQTPAEMLEYLRQEYPGHTIDLSAEPPEGISR